MISLGLKQVRTFKLHFGKMENFSVIQKEKYFNVCTYYEKKKYWQVSKVPNDNLCYFAFYS